MRAPSRRPNRPGSALARARRARGWTKAHVASRLQLARQSYERVELGIQMPWPRFRREAAALFGVDEAALFPPVIEVDAATARRLAEARDER